MIKNRNFYSLYSFQPRWGLCLPEPPIAKWYMEYFIVVFALYLVFLSLEYWSAFFPACWFISFWGTLWCLIVISHIQRSKIWKNVQILESHTIILLIIFKILVHCSYLHKQKNASLVIFSQSLSLNEIQILASFFGEYV